MDIQMLDSMMRAAMANMTATLIALTLMVALMLPALWAAAGLLKRVR